MEDNSVVKQEKTPHRWEKGESGNLNGRPRKPEIEILRDALEKAKNKHGKHFIEHFVEKAYTNDQIAIALAKKILPDKLEGQGFEMQQTNYFQDLDNKAFKAMPVGDRIRWLNERLMLQWKKE